MSFRVKALDRSQFEPLFSLDAAELEARGMRRLNKRQLPIIQEALKRDAARYTIAEQARLHSVSYLTARADLENLANMGLLRKTKEGVIIIFLVPRDLKERLVRLGKS